QNFDDAASKFCSTFIEWHHVLWNKIIRLYEELQIRAKSDDIQAIFAKINADDIEKVWHQFLINIDIAAIRDESNGSNNFERLLLDVVRNGIWALTYYKQKPAQAVFVNLNNDLYTVNLNVLTISGWNVGTSIDLSRYTFNGQK
ncbi:16904_t:CDS:2, partial [Racocetra fulgida]